MEITGSLQLSYKFITIFLNPGDKFMLLHMYYQQANTTVIWSASNPMDNVSYVAVLNSS